MESYSDLASYSAALDDRGNAPVGFHCAVTSIDFRPAERETTEPLTMNLSAVVLDEPTRSFSGMFTKNRFPGAPVILCRERIAGSRISGILVNNRIANVCAPDGVEDARRVTGRFAAQVGCEGDEILPASTGIIGWKLPVDAMIPALAPLARRLGSDTPVDVARGIMTTDSYPKLRSAGVGDGRIVCVAKGAGMIEPDMATLLVFIFTDISIERKPLQRHLEDAVTGSFNIVSVDGDQSTSDMVIALTSNRKRCDEVEFAETLSRLCYELAMDVIRNGEGTEHVIRVRVASAPSREIAAGCAKAVVNSPLVKTAVCGNDPNVGRVIGAIGDFAGSNGVGLDTRAVRVAIGDEEVFAGGVFTLDPDRERRLARYLTDARSTASEDGFPAHDRSVEICIDLGSGNSTGGAIGSDLTHGYVSENADYRS